MRRLNRLLAGSAIALVPLVASPSATADTLLLAAPVTPEGFDGDALRPHTQNVVVQVYEPLVVYARTTDAQGREVLDPTSVEPHLAESWSVSEDGTRYVVKLREGVLSPYGNELTAADVVWGWEKSFAQKRTGSFIARVSNVTGVREVSRYEVEFELAAPSSIFLRALTLYVPAVYDSTEVKKHATTDDPWALDWLATNTAGFGAYHLSELRAGEMAVFTANPNYFRDPPHFDRVLYRAIPSAASRATLLKSGQVQWIDRPPIEQVLDFQEDANVKVQDFVGTSLASIRMNPKFAPFDDVRVRQAFNYAIDKDAINEAVFRGTATQARTLIPPLVTGGVEEPWVYDHDPEKARELLAAAGCCAEPIELLYSDLWWWLEPMVIQVADQLGDLGVDVQPVRTTGSEMRSRSAPGEQSMPFFAWEDGPIVLDPVYTMFLVAHSNGVSNRAGYSNAALDALIDEARTTLDEARKLEIMAEAQGLWAADAPWILTHYPTVFEAMAPDITGWVFHPDMHERWYDLRVE